MWITKDPGRTRKEWSSPFLLSTVLKENVLQLLNLTVSGHYVLDKGTSFLQSVQVCVFITGREPGGICKKSVVWWETKKQDWRMVKSLSHTEHNEWYTRINGTYRKEGRRNWIQERNTRNGTMIGHRHFTHGRWSGGRVPRGYLRRVRTRGKISKGGTESKG